MKKLYFLSLLFPTLLFWGCSKDFLKRYEDRIEGSWQLTDVDRLGWGGSTSGVVFRDGLFTFSDNGKLEYVSTSARCTRAAGICAEIGSVVVVIQMKTAILNVMIVTFAACISQLWILQPRIYDLNILMKSFLQVPTGSKPIFIPAPAAMYSGSDGNSLPPYRNIKQADNEFILIRS